MPSIERARAKHNALTAQLAKINDKLDKMDAQRSRLLKKKDTFIRAIVRSAKRLDKLAIVTHNGGPTTTPLPNVIDAMDTKPAPSVPNDPVPDLGKLTPEQADKAIKSKPLPVYDFDPKPRGKKTRRTPDDFATDMKNKKAASGKADGLR